MADKKDSQELSQTEPASWQKTKKWLDSLSEDKSSAKIANALLTNPDNINFILQRSGIRTGVILLTRSWDQFSKHFGDSKRAEQLVDLLQTQKDTEGTRAIRILDVFFDSMAGNLRLTGINEIVSWIPKNESEYNGKFSDNDWQALMGELKDPNSIFLSDLEMKKLNETPRSSDPNLRPARYLVAALWSGGMGIKEPIGNLKKSIDYYKENYLKP